MSSLIDDLRGITKELIAKDRRKAMQVFMEKIHYEIAPCVAFGDTVELFKDESSVAEFCKEKDVDLRAFKWLLGKLREELILSPHTSSISFTEQGITRLCLEKNL